MLRRLKTWTIDNDVALIPQLYYAVWKRDIKNVAIIVKYEK